MKKQINKYPLKEVLLFRPFYTFFIALPIAAFWIGGFIWISGRHLRLAFLPMVTIFCFITCYALLKLISKNIEIWFEENFLFIKTSENKTIKIRKEEILGIKTYDYETQFDVLKTSQIKFTIYLRNGKKIYINDIEYRSKLEIEKAELLKSLLRKMQRELNFEKKDKRKYSKTFWYKKIN